MPVLGRQELCPWTGVPQFPAAWPPWNTCPGVVSRDVFVSPAGWKLIRLQGTLRTSAQGRGTASLCTTPNPANTWIYCPAVNFTVLVSAQLEHIYAESQHGTWQCHTPVVSSLLLPLPLSAGCCCLLCGLLGGPRPAPGGWESPGALGARGRWEMSSTRAGAFEDGVQLRVWSVGAPCVPESCPRILLAGARELWAKQSKGLVSLVLKLRVLLTSEWAPIPCFRTVRA